MNYKKLFWGIILILLGVFFLLRSIDVIDFSVRSIFKYLLPTIIILWGISILAIKDKIKILLSIGVLLASILLISQCTDSFNTSSKNYRNSYYNNDYDDDDDDDDSDDVIYNSTDTSNFNNTNLSEAFNENTKNAKLKMSVGVGNFYLRNNSEELILANIKNSKFAYSLETSDTDANSKVIDFSLKNNNIDKELMDFDNEVELSLNANPTWDLDLEIGASKIDFDLSSFKTKKIEIDGGVSDISLKLGDLAQDMDLDIEVGASNISIKVPYTSGVEITSSNVLSNKEFTGFDKLDGKFRSKDYSKAKHFIKINISSGLSNINIERY